MKKHISHGEVNIFECNSIPKGAKKIKTKDLNHYVLAPSETTGNDHRLELLEDTEIYELDGKIYVKNPTESRVYCPHEERHSSVPLPSSVWEINIAKEYDYLNQEIRNVAD